MDSCWFDNKTVIITGASSGIGKGLAKCMAEQHGCRVIGIGRNKEKMESLAGELKGSAGNFTYRLFDVSVKENWEQFAGDIKSENIKPDILINNAGILPKFDSFLSYPVEEVENIMQTNYFASVYSMHYLLPTILDSPCAAVINVASCAALCSFAGSSAYSASKMALKSLTESVREELRGKCYVGLVCPGMTKTEIYVYQGRGNSPLWSEKALDLIGCSTEKMTRKIIKGISQRKPDMVYGVDSRLMNSSARLSKVGSSRFCTGIIKISRLEMFQDVFKSTEQER